MLKQFFYDNNITTVFLSEIAKIEFTSTVWKKVRIQEMTELQAMEVSGLFKSDSYKFTFIQQDSIINEYANNLFAKYRKQGLGTLDSIQLTAAISLRSQAEVFITSDKLLSLFLNQEDLQTLNISS